MDGDEPFTSYRDLRVRQEAVMMAEHCYRPTAVFPKDETVGMTSQIRRAAASIAANVAEGHGRDHTGSFVQLLRIAQGSLKELETRLLLAIRVGLGDPVSANPIVERCDSLGRQLRALIRSLQHKVVGTETRR